tara:strand:+ start:682 stop:1008 length:327 start_codon:yes stop_codon:yes gene_type:complete
MIENYSKSKTPITSEKWINKSEEDRKKIINNELSKNDLYKDFEILKVPNNGQIVFKIERIISAKERGLLLLELEEKLKIEIDKGITVWCEPIGDKSKLRKLRGIEIKT